MHCGRTRRRLARSMPRLDTELVARGLARSRSHAQRLVHAGRVTLNGEVVSKVATAIRTEDVLAAEGDRYVSRSAHKLAGALDDLGLTLGGRALDAGASTGGFTQVLLERGCALVHAVDVGVGQLNPAVRVDPRVVVRERTNLRDLQLSHLDGRAVDLTVADVSFVSLTLLVEPLTRVTRPDGRLLLMVKPQFEVGRDRLGRNGVVREAHLRERAVAGVIAAYEGAGWASTAITPSRMLGAEGNQEFFVLLNRPTVPVAGRPDLCCRR